MIGYLDLSSPRKFITNKINDIIFEYKMMPGRKQHQFKTAIKVTEIALFITITSVSPVYAATDLTIKLMKAFQPVVDIIQALGYPAAVCSMTAGGVTMMFNKKLGVRIIKDTSIAFLVIQFIPSLLAILVEVGRAMK